MKVPDNLVYSIFQQQDARIRKELNKKTIEIATGKRLLDVSDDITATYDIIRLKKDIAELSQFSRNRLFADVNLTYADFVLSKMEDKMREIYAKTVQAKNQIQVADDLKAVGVQIKEALDFLLNKANEKLGENYLFSGSALDTKPFDENFNYLGSEEEFNVQIEEGNFVRVFGVGEKVFGTNVYELEASYTSPSDPLGVSGTLQVDYSSKTVSVDYGRGVWYLAVKITDPDRRLGLYGVEGDLILYDSANNEVARIQNIENYSLNDLITQINSTFGSENVSASLVNNPDGTYTLKIVDGDNPPNNFISNPEGFILENNSLENFVKIFNTVSPSDLRAYLRQKPDGNYTFRLIPESVETTLSISFPSGTALGTFNTKNVFQLIDELQKKLAGGFFPDESDLTAVQRSFDKVAYERASIGSVLAQVKVQEELQETREDVLNKQKSDVEDVTLSESIMDYTRYKIAYEALMKIVADSQNMTILRYI